MTFCNHSAMRCVAAFVLPAKPEHPRRAIISISCATCGAGFQFADGAGALCFDDARLNLSAWVIEKGDSRK
jgi:hypothetical protein